MFPVTRRNRSAAPLRDPVAPGSAARHVTRPAGVGPRVPGHAPGAGLGGQWPGWLVSVDHRRCLVGGRTVAVGVVGEDLHMMPYTLNQTTPTCARASTGRGSLLAVTRRTVGHRTSTAPCTPQSERRRHRRAPSKKSTDIHLRRKPARSPALPARTRRPATGFWSARHRTWRRSRWHCRSSRRRRCEGGRQRLPVPLRAG